MTARRSHDLQITAAVGRSMNDEEVDEALRRMVAAGYSDVEIGRHIGRDRQCVGRKRRELGIRPGYAPSLGAMLARLHLRRKMGATESVAFGA